ncbi:MAG: hypothetical protein NZ749_12270, partial [bacterium]|nr:hypothetical protein [bacterium]
MLNNRTAYFPVVLFWLCLAVSILDPTYAQSSRAFPSARWAWYIVDAGEADWPAGNMTKDDITLWMLQNTDWILAGQYDSYGTVYQQRFLPTRPGGILLHFYDELTWLAPSRMNHFGIHRTGLVGIITRAFETMPSQGRDPEDIFTHVAVDTDLVDQGTPLSYGYLGGWYRGDPSDSYPLNASTLYSGADSSKLRIANYWIAYGSFYPFNEMQVDIAQAYNTGSVILEYPSSRDPVTGVATEWKPLTILEDQTNGFRQSGWIRWQVPSDWVVARAINHSMNYGAYYIRVRTVSALSPDLLIAGVRTRDILRLYPTIRAANQAIYIGLPSASASEVSIQLRRSGVGGSYVYEYRNTSGAWVALSGVSDGTNGLGQSGNISWSPPSDWALRRIDDLFGRSGRAYWIRIRATSAPTQFPEVASVAFAGSTLNPQFVWGSRYTITIPGWDSANDRNGDGYVDDTEFGNLANPNATARRRWHSRYVKA